MYRLYKVNVVLRFQSVEHVGDVLLSVYIFINHLIFSFLKH